MSLVVVRCPACLGASRVETDALGQMVACPRCQVPFVAAEEVVPTIQPIPRSTPARPSTVASQPRRRPNYREEPPEPELTPPPIEVPTIPDPEHDPHLPPVAGLPVSVLVGLSLLPFAIPLLWWGAPIIIGQDAALSLAVPTSLAIAASALCLGVVYTIDWTASTRVKGVLMLVSLAYLSGAGLFFLKKDWIERLRDFGAQKATWLPTKSPEGRFQVNMPGIALKTEDQPLLPLVRMTVGMQVKYRPDADMDAYGYLVASGRFGQLGKEADDDWFEAIGVNLVKENGPPVVQPLKVKYQNYTGREWQFQISDETYRFVRIFVIEGRVYYLSVEGRHLTATDEYAEYASRFFNSFQPKVTD